MADCSEIEARLEAARKAYDDLITGGAVSRFVDQNGESVSYSKTSASGLLAYISRLEDQLAACRGIGRQYRGPIKFLFGRRC